jgi:hypothetical protein
MLLLLIPIAWLSVATLVVCLCRMAAMADADGTHRTPRGGIRAEVLVLERVPLTTLRPRARSRARRPELKPRGLATIHSIR